MKIKLQAMTDAGRVRDHNEDSFLVLKGNDCPLGLDSLMVIADGMGGHAAGEVASEMTVNGISHGLNNHNVNSSFCSSDFYLSLLTQIITGVNEQVWQASQEPGKRGMGTTCVLAAIKEDRLFLAHVGDSRAYLFRDDELYQLTVDHSWVAEAVTQGQLTKEEARNHYNRNVITRAIGTNPTVEVDTASSFIEKRDLLVICSDGLNSMLSDEQISEILRTYKPKDVCRALVQGANVKGGEDNITVITALVQKGGNSNDQRYRCEKTRKIKNGRFKFIS